MTLSYGLMSVVLWAVGEGGTGYAEGATTVNTAIGSFGADIDGFVSGVGKFGVALGGIAAIALLAVGAITILTSAGNPDKLMEGREMITNALMGLALIALALFVLRFLGTDLLGISGF